MLAMGQLPVPEHRLTVEPGHARYGWLSAALIVAAAVAFIVWIVLVTITIQVCPVLDVRMISGPAVALLLAGAGTTAAIAMLRLRSTAIGVGLLTLGVLECIAFGLEVVQAMFCIPAAP